MLNKREIETQNFIKEKKITDADIISITKQGKSIEDIIKNYNLIIETFSKGVNFVTIKRPLIESDVRTLSDEELCVFENRYEADNDIKWPTVFIPASGSATRMFGYLDKFYHSSSVSKENYSKVIDTIIGLDLRSEGPKFAFIDQLEDILKANGYDLDNLVDDSLNGDIESIKLIIKYMLYEEGLNFIKLPKALIPSHKRNGKTISALHDHIEDVSHKKKPKLKISILPFSENLFLEKIKEIKKTYPHLADVEVDVSFQKPMTDSIAIDPNTTDIIRDANEQIVFFPGGHGSLIYNLNEICFIKSIDSHLSDSDAQNILIKHHKAMLVILKDVKKIICDTLIAIEDDNFNREELQKALDLLLKNKVDLFLDHKRYNDADFKLKKNLIKKALNRPIGIFGLVRNEGKPGGGPFIYCLGNKQVSSIIEESEISEEQKSLMKNGIFFNPVNMLVDPSDHKAKCFEDLRDFEDSDRYISVKKIFNGNKIIRTEHPGLWNGRMAKYNKVWLSLPSCTFSPVKELVDLLNKYHDSGKIDQ